jgi:hypothetical protein
MALEIGVMRARTEAQRDRARQRRALLSLGPAELIEVLGKLHGFDLIRATQLLDRDAAASALALLGEDTPYRDLRQKLQGVCTWSMK